MSNNNKKKKKRRKKKGGGGGGGEGGGEGDRMKLNPGALFSQLCVPLPAPATSRVSRCVHAASVLHDGLKYHQEAFSK